MNWPTTLHCVQHSVLFIFQSKLTPSKGAPFRLEKIKSQLTCKDSADHALMVKFELKFCPTYGSNDWWCTWTCLIQIILT